MSAIKWRPVRGAHNVFETDQGYIVAKVKVAEKYVYTVTAPGAKESFAYLRSREEVVKVIEVHMKGEAE